MNVVATSTEQFETPDGTVSYFAEMDHVWITKVEVKVEDQYAYVRLYKQAMHFFLTTYQNSEITLFIAPEEKLLAHFLKSDEYFLDYVAFKYIKN